MSHYLSMASLVVYAASFAGYARVLSVPNMWVGRAATGLLGGGIVLHYFALLERSRWVHTVPYDDLYGSMSLFAWLLAITYLGVEIFHQQRSVGAFVTLLLIVWVALLDAFAPGVKAVRPPARGALFALHVTLNTWAYAAFALSFVLSLIYIAQDRLLRSRKLGREFWHFPALDALDRMARTSVYIGLLALVTGATLGLMWEHRLTGGFALRDPKVIVTAAILLVYVAYLWLSRNATWRGARAARLCALNFVMVLFSYTFVNLYLTRFHRYF
jgi:ABC-type transport system involved in cytochrome c biogenesis permease subunit